MPSWSFMTGHGHGDQTGLSVIRGVRLCHGQVRSLWSNFCVGCCSIHNVSAVPVAFYDCPFIIFLLILTLDMEASSNSEESRPSILHDTTELFSHPSGWRVHVRKGPIAAAAAIERYVAIYCPV